MKYLIALLTALPALASAQACRLGAEAARYTKQKSWQPYAVKDDRTPGAIQGLIDENGNFHFQSLSRRGDFMAELKVDPSNKSYKDFFRFCQTANTRSEFLTLMRKTESNRYSVQVRFLPSLKGFANDPYKEQHFKIGWSKLALSISEDASVRQDLDFESYEPTLRRQLSSQLDKQSEFGVISLDLSGQDDFVCDLVQGKASLGAEISGLSDSPVITQTERVKPEDVVTIYQTVKGISDSESRAAQWLSGIAVHQLSLSGKIANYDPRFTFEIFQKLSDPTSGRVSLLSGGDLSCIADSMQTYETGIQPQNFNIHMLFESPRGPL